jgi:hypothetical protein
VCFAFVGFGEHREFVRNSEAWLASHRMEVGCWIYFELFGLFGIGFHRHGDDSFSVIH